MISDKNSNINSVISKYKYVHLISNDKFCIPIINFINAQFGENDNVFLVSYEHNNLPFPNNCNIYELEDIEDLDFSVNSIKKVIMHSLYIKGCFKYWYEHREIQSKKGYWIIYGGDLYDAPRNEMADTVRSNFKGYISDTDGDCEVARKKYNLVDKEYICASYSFPITLEMLNNALGNRLPHDKVRIQINNSCDDTTLEMLDALSRYIGNKIEVSTILSYGKMKYKGEIIEKGKALFGDDFHYLEKLLTPEEYAKWLVQNDIYILNQNRQQGLGNAIASLSCGKKVYIKKEITTFSHFMSRDIQIYDSNLIDKLSWEEFINYDDDIRERTMKKARMFYDDTYLKECWEPVFRDK